MSNDIEFGDNSVGFVLTGISLNSSIDTIIHLGWRHPCPQGCYLLRKRTTTG